MGMKKCDSCGLNFVADDDQDTCGTCEQLMDPETPADTPDENPLHASSVGEQFLYMARMYSLATTEEREGIIKTVEKLLFHTGELIAITDAANQKYFEALKDL